MTEAHTLPTALRDRLWSVYVEGAACGLGSDQLAAVLLNAGLALIAHDHGESAAVEWLEAALEAARAEGEAQTAKRH